MAQQSEQPKPHKRIPKPTPFMQAIRKRRLELMETDKSYGQEGVAAILGVTFQTYSDYELGRVNISHSKAEMLLELMVDENDRGRYRQMDGFPPNEKTASEVLEPVARRLFPGEEPMSLAHLLRAVRSERPNAPSQQSFLGAVEGAAINNGELDPTANRFKEIIGKLGFDGSDQSIEAFYREGHDAAERIATREREFARAMFVMRHYDREHQTLHMPSANNFNPTAAWSFKQLSEALDDAGHPISDGHLKRFELKDSVPSRQDAQVIAGIFGFGGPTAEADMYAEANRLRQAHPHFPEKAVSKPSLSVAQFGQKLRDIRKVLGISQDDLVLLDPALSKGIIASAESGERKTPLPQGIVKKIHKALEVNGADEFDALADAAAHVLAVREKNFGDTLKLWREEMLGRITQNALYQKVKEEYDRLQEPQHYGIAFTDFADQGQVGSWEHGTVPSHPMMIRAVVRTVGAANEAQFFLDGGMNEDEIRQDAFKKVDDHLDKFYKALIARSREDDTLRKGFSVFSQQETPTKPKGPWEATARPQKEDGTGVGGKSVT